MPDIVLEAFSEAYQFGIIMLIIGLISGGMIGWGLRKIYWRRVWQDPLA